MFFFPSGRDVLIRVKDEWEILISLKTLSEGSLLRRPQDVCYTVRNRIH